jgi:hypothetical protein
MVFGWNLVPMPAVPAAPASIEYLAVDTVALATSVFTGQQQTQDWQAGWMEWTVTMPAMPHALAQAWIAWLLGLRGIAGVFQIGDPLAAQPQGTGAGAPIVVGSGQTGVLLNTTGWVGAGALLPGDYLQIGYRLYRCLSTVNNGAQTLSIWPQIRESPPDGTAIVVFNTQGLFRLKGNPRKWSVSDNRTYGIQFDVREAI